ncbi:MAG: adenosyl-hopene transferase HpnH [Deltaproteobacteria bacterium]|nr:adenosyl-hopene transferase HpnH [Deltaproteobacteria bacterium]
MSIPVAQGLRIFSYILKQKILGNKKYPLVLMLEPLFRCNLECPGCGKIQYPDVILKQHLTVEECLKAAEECGAPVVSIPGGEPLLHPDMPEIVTGLIKQKRYIYLCTNAILLKRRISQYAPSGYLTWSVHLDGLRDIHDHAVKREGVFDQAVAGIKEALSRGHRVTTNTTIYEGMDIDKVREFFDFVMDLGVEGMVLSPGFPYEQARDQGFFLKREKSKEFFKEILTQPHKKWVFNQSPFYLKFLTGEIDYQCTPWGTPTRNIFGWQRPCYLLNEGSEDSFKKLISNTRWQDFGTGNNPKCADCMMSCGYEPSAVVDSFSSLKKFLRTVREF